MSSTQLAPKVFACHQSFELAKVLHKPTELNLEN